MSKEAYYFSHDANARNDEKIIKLRFKHGWEGYGIYWGLIERLRESPTYKLKTDYELIAFDMQTQCERIESVIQDFDLFIIEGEDFYSISLMSRMEMRSAKSASARKSAQARWDKAKVKDANALQTQSEGNASKGKEKKVKESKRKEDRAKEFATNTKKLITEKKIQISESEANNFIEYWCETGINDLKLRFEKERTFGLSRRLSTWMNNNFSSNNTTQQTGEPKLQFYKGCE